MAPATRSGPAWGPSILSALAGKSVLIVEDEPLVALEVHGALSAAGASIISAATASEAIRLIGYAEISAALVDVQLGNENAARVCDLLGATADTLCLLHWPCREDVPRALARRQGADEAGKSRGDHRRPCGCVTQARAVGAHSMATFTVRQGKRYRATIALGMLERFASNGTIASRLQAAGFTEVSVSGNGATRHAEARWPKSDESAEMPAQITAVAELPETA